VESGRHRDPGDDRGGREGGRARRSVPRLRTPPVRSVKRSFRSRQVGSSFSLSPCLRTGRATASQCHVLDRHDEAVSRSNCRLHWLVPRARRRHGQHLSPSAKYSIGRTVRPYCAMSRKKAMTASRPGTAGRGAGCIQRRPEASPRLASSASNAAEASTVAMFTRLFESAVL
jgi:hypothetical protein